MVNKDKDESRVDKASIEHLKVQSTAPSFDAKTQSYLRYADKVYGGTMESSRANKKVSELLDGISKEFTKATEAQPCPGCKYDMDQINKFITEKTEALKNKGKVSDKTRETLRDVAYINEFTNLGIFLTKILDPLTNIVKVTAPEMYKKVMEEDREGNIAVRKHLRKALKLANELVTLSSDRDFTNLRDIIKYSLNATEFKLSIDPVEFFVFDKVIKFGHKTHILQLAGRGIMLLKGIT